MPGKEFEIARKLMQDGGADSAPGDNARKALEPAFFREIDGRELARQYVAHRKLMEAQSRNPLPLQPQEHSAVSVAKAPEDPAPSPAAVPARLAGRVIGWIAGVWRR